MSLPRRFQRPRGRIIELQASQEVKEGLRQQKAGGWFELDHENIRPIGEVAADEIERLEKENERLKAALEICTKQLQKSAIAEKQDHGTADRREAESERQRHDRPIE
jgi:hypothetical protein